VINGGIEFHKNGPLSTVTQYSTMYFIYCLYFSIFSVCVCTYTTSVIDKIAF